MRPDLSIFDGNQMKWKDRYRLICDVFPAIERLDWEKVFDVDEGVWGQLMYVILQADAATPGRDGPRPALDPATAIRRLHQLAGNDYSELPFAEAFRALAGGRSVRHVASKVSLTVSYTYRLLQGAQKPSIDGIEKIATGFGKAPAYFIEYRSAVLGALLTARLMEMPETSIDVYRRAVSSRR